MVRPSEQLKRVVAAGPYTWPVLDKLEPMIVEIVRQLGDLAADPGFTGEAATAVSDYADALRSDYQKVLDGIDAARYMLDRANVAWSNAVRKYATFDDADTGLLATLSTGGLNIVFDAIDDLLDGENDDDRGIDGLEQLRQELAEVPQKPFPNYMDFKTGGARAGSPPDWPPPGWPPPDDPPPVVPRPDFDGGDVDLNPYVGTSPNFGSGLAIDGPGAGISGGGGGGAGGGGVGGMHGVSGGVGSGAQLGGVGMLGAGVGAGAAAAGAAAAAKAGGKGMMGGGGGMGGGGAAQEKSKRPSSGLKAPELEEDADAAPRSEGAGAGGRASTPDED